MKILSLLHDTMEHDGKKWINVLKEIKEDIADYIAEKDIVGENSYLEIKGGF